MMLVLDTNVISGPRSVRVRFRQSFKVLVAPLHLDTFNNTRAISKLIGLHSQALQHRYE